MMQSIALIASGLDDIEDSIVGSREISDESIRALGTLLGRALGGSFDSATGVLRIGDFEIRPDAWLHKLGHDTSPHALLRKAALVAEFLALETEGPGKLSSWRAGWAVDAPAADILARALDITEKLKKQTDSFFDSWLAERHLLLDMPARERRGRLARVISGWHPDELASPLEALFVWARLIKFDDWLTEGVFGSIHPGLSSTFGGGSRRITVKIGAGSALAAMDYMRDCYFDNGALVANGVLKALKTCVLAPERSQPELWGLACEFLMRSRSMDALQNFRDLSAAMPPQESSGVAVQAALRKGRGLWLLAEQIAELFPPSDWARVARLFLGEPLPLRSSINTTILKQLAEWTVSSESQFNDVDDLDGGANMAAVIARASAIRAR